ncbi:hypothetical protein DY000_02046970 [Brassica cretica]|uniref:Uncharacterized protein n=1 Tax=Brassica cretica TaxID=69181 RepID=A0ABQ7F6Z7_BRACR|nr:hypothetical protein DY000_02046970 [Brassica cretica]
MVANLILVRDERGDLDDQEGHLRNAAGQRIDAQGAAIPEYMPSSTRSNKETQLLFSQDHVSLERSIRKEARSSSIDNNACSSLDFRQSPSTQALVPSTDTRSSPSTKDTHLPSTDIFHPTSIDTSVRTAIDTEPRDMVATLILVRDERGDLHDHKGYLRNAAAKHPHPPSPVYVNIDRHSDPVIDRHQETPIDRQPPAPIDRQPPAPIDRGAPLTYRMHVPKIDVEHLNALRPKPKPSANSPETVRTPSDDGADPMEVDKVPTGRTLRRRKEKVAKHLKRGLWMFFRETRETEGNIRRMFCEAREEMRKRITLKKKSDPGKFAIPCTVETSKELFTFVDCSQGNSGGIVRDLKVQIGNALVPVDFHVLDIKLNWNSSLLLGRAFLSTVGAVCNLQTNQLCLMLIDPHVQYNPIPVTKPQTTSRRINDSRIIAACHCGAEYETEYSASIETHTAISIESAQQKLTDAAGEESVDSSQGEWENDYYNPTMAAHNMHTEEYDEYYEEERAIEKRATLDEEDRLLHHSFWKEKSPLIDRNDDRHHESYAVETAYRDQGSDELHEGFTYEELLNMQRRDETDQKRAEAAWERTHFSHPIERAIPPSININPSTLIDINHTTSIDIRPRPKTTDSADILQRANGADNLFVQQHNFPEHQQKITKEFYDTAGGIDKRFQQRSRHPTWPSIDIDDEYRIYRDDHGYTIDVDGHTIHVHNKDIRRLLERASRDDPNYICLPEHASSFTQTKLVPEIYTKDEINEMFYGVCGEQEKNKEDFQIKLDGNSACDRHFSPYIDRQTSTSIDHSHLPASIDNRVPASVDANPPHSHTMNSQPDFHTSEEIDQLVEGIYRALETTEERLDRGCDDIYFPMDLTISALTSKIEAIQGELVEIQSYIARRPEALASIDRRNNKSTDIHRQTSVDNHSNSTKDTKVDQPVNYVTVAEIV